jgi:menaquinone-dependent protoporphyrinogen oxidase
MRGIVAVASKHGATIEIGQRIAAVLVKNSIEACACPVEQIKSLRETDLVVLGSAVYANRMLPQMTAFCYRFTDLLVARRGYLFCSGPFDAANPELVPLPLDARDFVRRAAFSGSIMFGGKLTFDNLKPTERALMRMVGARAGDSRDWEAIEAWAQWVAQDALDTDKSRPVS